MTIEGKIRKYPEYKKLLRFIDTPTSKSQGSTCTASGTTVDTQMILIKLLSKDTRNSSYVSSTLYNMNTKKFISSSFSYNINRYSDLLKILEQSNFQRVPRVSREGDFSANGDIIIFWPSLYLSPIRASFWGDKIDSLEQIDNIYQKSTRRLKSIVFGDESILEDDIEKKSLRLRNDSLPYTKKSVFFTNERSKFHFNFKFHYPALYFRRLDLFKKNVSEKLNNEWTVFISTNHSSELRDLTDIFTKKKFKSGFENTALKLVVYTDREIFGSIYIAQERDKHGKRDDRYLSQLEGEIKQGNYIVHEDYGIAIYKGLEQKNVLGKKIDYLTLEYACNDTLSVPISQIHKLTKYIGPANQIPKISRLGKTNWKIIKNKVKESIIKLARDLLHHYAKVEITKGISLLPHEWEDKFASEFEFQETNDQKLAINDCLADLESYKPMNRLLVGDVGFGKTEVAIRAAFRAVLNSKQVAVLCPTTILVSQHYSVFKHRMKKYPIRIATLSRFGTRKENEKIISELAKGKVDIIIGTHRLLSSDVKFTSLNLLIIDEEQKFGVKQKEKIKKFSYDANVLYMTATPIPRTLGMALSKIRDISLITTPPPGRRPINTSIEHINWKKISQAILNEKRRMGQIYFVHNEVRTIESVKDKLEKLLPDIRFKIAHGQMHPSTLEKIMREFYQHKFDCLICTTIIENGIDIKNVNTIIINKAQNFGLSQLYQLRGRVGRGEKQSYCHLFYSQKELLSTTENKKNVSFQKAQARLKAIFEAQELGSGFKVASRDLEIRGMGNLLGKEQHGNMAKIGIGLYTQLLSDEIERQRKEHIDKNSAM